MAIIRDENTGARLVRGEALALVRRDVMTAAAVTKTIEGPHRAGHDARGQRRSNQQDFFAFQNSLNKRSRRNADASAMMQMLPESELICQILISSILSPKDMMEAELNYVLANADDFSSDLANQLIERFRKHFSVDYKVIPKLPDMIREALIEKGAYILATIPENAIDQVINGGLAASMESLSMIYYPSGAVRGVGVLGSGKDPEAAQNNRPRLGISLESFSLRQRNLEEEDYKLQYADGFKTREGVVLSLEEFVRVTDNPSALKTNALQGFLDKRNTTKVYAAALESINLSRITQVSDAQIERAMYRHRSVKSEAVAEVPTQGETSRRFVGMPLVLKLPSESVVPVHVPGDPSNHVAYYVILDEHGYPISSPDTDLLVSPSMSQGANPVQSALIQRSAANLGVSPDNFDYADKLHMQTAVRIYGDMVERDLINRVRNGVQGATVSLSRNDNVYRLMLSRVLARKFTQVLYLPMEYMTYMAFDYSSDGVGRSLMDKQSMIGMLRTTLMFSDLIGSIKNSIGRTTVTGKLPEDDPDVMKTIEQISHQIVESRQLNVPTRVSNPSDIMGWLQRASMDFQWEGHPGLPEIKLNFEQTQSNHQKPDSQLQDDLRKSWTMGFGLSPETVDKAYSAEFATTAMIDNVLLSKRVVMWQNTFTPHLTQHMRQHARYSENLVKDLYQILKDNRDKILLELDKVEGVDEVDPARKDQYVLDYALRRLLDNLEVQLPKPTSVTLEKQMQEFDTYSQALDKALLAYITPEIMAPNIVGDMSEQVATLQSMIKGHFLRKWMAEKGIFTELNQLLAVDTIGQPQGRLVDEIKSHVQAMTKAGITTLVGLSANRDAATADLKASGAVPGPEASSSFGGGGGGSFGGGMDDFGGGGDFGGGLDTGLGEDDLSLTPDGPAEEQPDDGAGTTNPDDQSNDTTQGASGADTTQGGAAA